jgi:hypothetical protein
MSKNYELLQQAQFGIGPVPTITTSEQSVPEQSIASVVPKVCSISELVVREEALKLVQRLFLSPDQSAPKAVLFAAIDANFGCNWLCSLTAKLLAKSVSGSVCLVEGNFRSPSFSESFGVNRERGLIDSLRHDGPIREFVSQGGAENLWLLPSGSPIEDPMILLNGTRMRDRFQELRKEFDYIVMNAPPLNVYADGMVLGRLMDGVVVVLEANASRREAALRVTNSLRTTNIPILGAVLNNRTFPIPEAVYKRL